MRILAIVVFLCCAAITNVPAQHSGYHMPDTTTAKYRAIDRKLNGPREGMLMPEFTAVTTDGIRLNNALLKGKVSLLLFWDPWCGCFNPDALGALPAIAKERRDFQIISMMADTGRLAIFKSQYPLPTPVAILRTYDMYRELHGGMGIPSCMLVDRNGIIVKVSSGLHRGLFDEQAFTDKIRELLMF